MLYLTPFLISPRISINFLDDVIDKQNKNKENTP